MKKLFLLLTVIFANFANYCIGMEQSLTTNISTDININIQDMPDEILLTIFNQGAESIVKTYSNAFVLKNNILKFIKNFRLINSRFNNLKPDLIKAIFPSKLICKLKLVQEAQNFLEFLKLNLANKKYTEMLNVKSNASKQVIRTSWKQLLLKWHPDKAVSLGIPEDISTEITKLINAAYNVAYKGHPAGILNY